MGKKGLRGFTEPHGVPGSRVGVFYAISQSSQFSGVGGFSSTLQMWKQAWAGCGFARGPTDTETRVQGSKQGLSPDMGLP